MSGNTLVSIVMPAYKLRYFEQTLDSVLAQTYPALELVICDDNRTEAIAEVVERRAASPWPRANTSCWRSATS